MLDFTIDPELSRAETLPAGCYWQPDFATMDRDRVFHRTWQVVGRVEQVQRPFDYLTAEIGGEPAVVVRDKHGVLRALHNVCRHRASPVARGCGHATSLQCPYHGWTYDLEGRLQGQPEFEGVENWDKSSVRLPPMEVQAWGPFVFARVTPGGPSFADMLGNIPADLEKNGIDLSTFRLLTRKDYVVECNWKVYIDNYLEGYHLPMVHPQLFRELDYPRYRVDTFRYHSFQHAPLRPLRLGAERRYDPGQGASTALYYWIFPNFILNAYPDNLSTNVILPLGPERTLAIFEWFVPQSRGKVTEVDAQTIASFSDQVQHEDTAICELVQRGLHSSSYRRGRYSVKRENGVHHFHRLLEEFWRD